MKELGDQTYAPKSVTNFQSTKLNKEFLTLLLIYFNSNANKTNI